MLRKPSLGRSNFFFNAYVNLVNVTGWSEFTSIRRTPALTIGSLFYSVASLCSIFFQIEKDIHEMS